MKKLTTLAAAALLTAALTVSASASSLSHTVVKGDTMWKLAVKYQVGTSEIIAANPQIANPDLIYPGQILNIPQVPATVLSYENEVIRPVNEIRGSYGLKPLTANWELSRIARYKSEDMSTGTFPIPAPPTALPSK